MYWALLCLSLCPQGWGAHDKICSSLVKQKVETASKLGILSLTELRSLLDEIGQKTDREALIEVINTIDADANMEISYSEFIQHFRGRAPAQALNVYI